jgi:hypothetical protein
MLQPDYTQQRVFVIGEGSLFDEGVKHMLSQRPDLLVSSLIFGGGLGFLNYIRLAQPDVVLVCESTSLHTTDILDLFSSPPIMMELRIVIIRLRDNRIDVYAEPILVAGNISRRRQQITAKNEDDLLKALLNDLVSIT